MTPLLLQPVRVIFASEDNPTKVGLFLRTKRITGVMNRGRYWELLNADGSTSCTPVTDAVPICTVEELPAAGEWIDCLYYGFMKKVSLDRCAHFVNIARGMLPAPMQDKAVSE